MKRTLLLTPQLNAQHPWRISLPGQPPCREALSNMQPFSAILSQVRLSNPYISLTRSIRLFANNTRAANRDARAPPCVSGLPASQWTPSKCEPESSHPGQRQLWSAHPSMALEVLHNGHRRHASGHRLPGPDCDNMADMECRLATHQDVLSRMMPGKLRYVQRPYVSGSPGFVTLSHLIPTGLVRRSEPQGRGATLGGPTSTQQKGFRFAPLSPIGYVGGPRRVAGFF